MNLGSDAAFDLAAERTAQERDAGIAAARAALTLPGRAECVECDNPIPDERRLAYPSAIRCVTCQQLFECQEAAR